jgi:hypothetical protein
VCFAFWLCFCSLYEFTPILQLHQTRQVRQYTSNYSLFFTATVTRLPGGAVVCTTRRNIQTQYSLVIESSYECILCLLYKLQNTSALSLSQNKLERLPVFPLLFTVYFMYLCFSSYNVTNNEKRSPILKSQEENRHISLIVHPLLHLISHERKMTSMTCTPEKHSLSTRIKINKIREIQSNQRRV